MKKRGSLAEGHLFRPTKDRKPLAFRMRPRSLDEVIGQPNLTGPRGILRAIAKTGVLPSLIFWGPPGTGKSSTAYLMAQACGYQMIAISAVSSGIKEMKEAVQQADTNFDLYGKSTVFFIDEIHRFHKGQQSFLLPYVEEGTVTLIGSTTENPSFEVIPPLLSRSQVVIFQKIPPEDLLLLLKRALRDNERGLGKEEVDFEEEALVFLAEWADGDARRALNFLEVAFQVAKKEGKKIEVSFLKELFGGRTLLYDKGGEEHFNLLSAYHKSLRGSDPDGAIYWMVRMLDGGEDPHAILRRLIACASEDVGNADPRALLLALAAREAYDFLGEPEGRLSLAQATVYVAAAPKSNASYRALHQALNDVKKFGSLPVPLHIRNAPTDLMKKEGYGKDYRYAHDYPGGFTLQNYLPKELRRKIYYRPTERGYEKKIGQWLNHLWGEEKNYKQ